MRQAARKTSAQPRPRGSRPLPASRRAPQPAPAGVALATLAGSAGQGFRVRLGDRDVAAAVDPAVDPQLLTGLLGRNARVLVDLSAEGRPVIVGALVTRRVVEIDAQGDVDVSVRRFAVSAQEKVLLRLPAAFVQLTQDEIELYGRRVLSRARDLFKVLATMIKLN
jgi:hypothetical protein